MSDLVFTTQGNAEILAAQEAQRAAAQRAREEFEHGAKATGVWDTAISTLSRNANSALKSIETEQQKIVDQINAIKEGMAKGLVPPDEAKKGIEELEKRWKAAGDAGEKSFGPEAVGKLKEFASELAGVAGVGLSVAGAIEEIKNEYDSLVELRAEAGKEQLSLAAAHELLIRNQVGASKDQLAKSLETAKQIADKAGVPEAIADQTLGSAYSVAGGDRGQAERAALLAQRSLPDQPAGAGDLAQTLLQLGKPPDEALGLIRSIGSLAGIRGDDVYKKLPGALSTLTGYGFSPETSGALFAAIQQETKDPSGKLTASTTADFAKALTSFVFTDKADEKTEKAQEELTTAEKETKRAKQELADHDRDEARRQLLADRDAGDARLEFAKADRDLQHPDRPLKARERETAIESRNKALERITELDQDRDEAASKAAEERARRAQQLADAEAAERGARTNLAATAKGGKGLTEEQTIYDGLSPEERIKYLQSHPDLMAPFLKDAGINARSLPTVTSFLQTGGGRLGEFQGKIPGSAALAADGASLEGSYDLSPFRRQQKLHDAIASGTEELQTGGDKYLDPESRANLIKIMQNAGITNRSAQARLFLESLRDGKVGVSIGDAENTIKDLDQQLRHPFTTKTSPQVITPIGDFGSFPTTAVAQPNEAENRAADALEKILTVIQSNSGIPVTSD